MMESMNSFQNYTRNEIDNLKNRMQNLEFQMEETSRGSGPGPSIGGSRIPFPFNFYRQET